MAHTLEISQYRRGRAYPRCKTVRALIRRRKSRRLKARMQSRFMRAWGAR